MAGTTTKSRDNAGQPKGALRDLIVQFQKVITDLATACLPLIVNSTAVGNVGAGEDDLMTGSIPADTLNAAGNGVEIEAWGTSANNATGKTLKLYFGATAILSQALTASQAGKWRVTARVLRTGSDAQDTTATIIEGTAALGAGKNATEIGTAVIDEDAAITVKMTGTAGADNDIVQEGFIVKAIRAAGDLTAAKIGNEKGTVITS